MDGEDDWDDDDESDEVVNDRGEEDSRAYVRGCTAAGWCCLFRTSKLR